MLIDPFTVGAQVLNFLVLVWLLRRILYGPITRAMTAREARIREQLAEAQRLREQAQAEGERYRVQLAAFEAEREGRLADARAELETWRREHMQAVRNEVEAMRQRWQQALQQERDAFLLSLRRRTAHEVLAVTRRALHDLADSELEARVISRFLEQLQRLGPARREQLAAAAREDGGQVHVRTAYTLADADRRRIQEEFDEALGAGLTLHFGTAPDLISGLELRAGGLKVAWALSDYLQSLDDVLEDTFGDRPEATDGKW